MTTNKKIMAYFGVSNKNTNKSLHLIINAIPTETDATRSIDVVVIVTLVLTA